MTTDSGEPPGDGVLKLIARKITSQILPFGLAVALVIVALILLQFAFKDTGSYESASSSALKEPYPVLDDANFWEKVDEALKADDVKEIERLTDGVDIKVSKSDGSNLLHNAVFQGADKVVELLLEKGVDPSVAAPEGTTPLMLAASRGNVELARVLVEKGAVVDYYNNDGFSPLMAACLQGKPSSEIIVFLYENGADVNGVSPKDVTPLEFAIAMNNIEAFDTLLELGAEVRETIPAKNWTVMKWANYHNTALKDDSYLKLLEAHLGTEQFREKMSLESSTWNQAD